MQNENLKRTHENSESRNKRIKIDSVYLDIMAQEISTDIISSGELKNKTLPEVADFSAKYCLHYFNIANFLNTLDGNMFQPAVLSVIQSTINDKIKQAVNKNGIDDSNDKQTAKELAVIQPFINEKIKQINTNINYPKELAVIRPFINEEINKPINININNTTFASKSLNIGNMPCTSKSLNIGDMPCTSKSFSDDMFKIPKVPKKSINKMNDKLWIETRESKKTDYSQLQK